MIRRFGLAALALAAPLCAQGQATPGVDVPVPAAPTPAVSVPGAAKPAAGAPDAPAGPPAYHPSLPAGTPEDQVERDPAQPVTTLVEALQRTYWTNPQLLSARATTRSIDYRVPQARSQYGPQLQYSASYTYTHDIFEQTVAAAIQRHGWTSTASAILTQPLFTFGRLRAGEDTARAQVAFQRASLAASEQQALLQAVGAYESVLRDRAGVGIAQSQVDLLAREFGDTRIRLEQRDATASDFQQVESRLELARGQLEVARGTAASSEATFLSTVGAPAGELAAPNPLVVPVQTLEDAYVFAEAHNPVIASAYARERASRAQLQAAKSDMLPRIDLRGQGTVGTLTPYSDSLRETELLGAVTVSGNIDAGLRQARIGEAAAANDSDWRLIDNALRQNREELADAWSAWKTQGAAVERLRIAVQAAELAFLGAQEQRRAGLRTTSEILELARDLLTARSSLNSAMSNVFIAQARVLAALGALSHDRLLSGTPQYDPLEHFNRVADDADVPGLTQLVRAADSAFASQKGDRPLRDPAAPLGLGEVADPQVQGPPAGN